ncbi:hypothetical protein TSAR_005804 [Trichomalopsis sarcophagae]|uniref:SOCS box domain-containing protein n=1 Tax=Trichomalopsis sarcophagae TaxID=543379 RepID=A0A232EGU2_9HYME|nr:hypothetical protein TSAR_005804 [Trichomalopsis sarcophagae]
MIAVHFWRWINKVLIILLRVTPNRNERILDLKIKLGRACEREARHLIYKWSLIMQPVEVTSIMRQALLSDKPFIIEAFLKYYPRLEETSLDMVLTLAIQDHHEELVKRILQLPIDWLIRCEKKQGVAILYRGIDIFTQLINKGASKYLLMYAGHELLERAMECENLDYLRLLLEADVNVNAKNTFGSTALIYAVDRGDMPNEARNIGIVIKLYAKNSSISEYLLEKTAIASHPYSGKNVELLLKKGCPIVGAIVHHNNEALRILIKRKCLTHSSNIGTIQAVEMILETGEYDINEVSSFNETALTWTFKIDVCRKMEVLLQLGASLYPINKNVNFIYNEPLPWNTPKIFIPLLPREKVENQNINIEDELTLKECYPTLYDKYEKACLEWQRNSRQNLIAETWIPFIFSGYRRKLTIIITKIISREGRKARILIVILAPKIRPSEMREIIEGLVESSDLETVKLYTCHISAIHSALTAKRLDILEKLFELGATLDKYIVWNYLSLRQAMRYKDKTFLSLLLEKGISVNSSNRMGSTVLGDAIAWEDQEAVEILLKAGANIRKFQYVGQAVNGSSEIFELLINHAKKLGMPISSQQLLLERSASAPYIDSLENVQLLLDEGVPVNSRSRDERYAIETAILQENDHTLQLLLYDGADVEIATRSGEG